MTYIQRVKDDEGLEKKPQGKQNINPVGFPPIPLLCCGELTVFWYLVKAPKQAETIPIGERPKTKRDKRTNGKGDRSGKEMNMKYRNMRPKLSKKVRHSQVVEE